jgi:archaeosine-15-forming tRNA-guanine transglycosylase
MQPLSFVATGKCPRIRVLFSKTFEPVRRTSGHSFFYKNMIGCNQPQQDPVAESLATERCRVK